MQVELAARDGRAVLSIDGRPEAPLFYGASEFYMQDPDDNELALVEFAASDPGYMATAGAKKKNSRRRSAR